MPAVCISYIWRLRQLDCHNQLPEWNSERHLEHHGDKGKCIFISEIQLDYYQSNRHSSHIITRQLDHDNDWKKRRLPATCIQKIRNKVQLTLRAEWRIYALENKGFSAPIHYPTSCFVFCWTLGKIWIKKFTEENCFKIAVCKMSVFCLSFNSLIILMNTWF